MHEKKTSFRQHRREPSMGCNHYKLQEAHLNIDNDRHIRREWRGALVSSCYFKLHPPPQFGVEELAIKASIVGQTSVIWINGEVSAVRAR